MEIAKRPQRIRKIEGPVTCRCAFVKADSATVVETD
jgi:hypothetical protein